MMVVFEKLLLSEQEYCTQKKALGFGNCEIATENIT